jgi:hypothetical protein
MAAQQALTSDGLVTVLGKGTDTDGVMHLFSKYMTCQDILGTQGQWQELLPAFKELPIDLEHLSKISHSYR